MWKSTCALTSRMERSWKANFKQIRDDGSACITIQWFLIWMGRCSTRWMTWPMQPMPPCGHAGIRRALGRRCAALLATACICLSSGPPPMGWRKPRWNAALPSSRSNMANGCAVKQGLTVAFCRCWRPCGRPASNMPSSPTNTMARSNSSLIHSSEV